MAVSVEVRESVRNYKSHVSGDFYLFPRDCLQRRVFYAVSRQRTKLCLMFLSPGTLKDRSVTRVIAFFFCVTSSK